MSFKYIKKGGCCMNKCGCTQKQDNKLNTYDWLCDLPEGVRDEEFVEVQFKNTRKGYYRNSNNISVEKGDLVAVEATPGHDVGTVSLTGPLVLLQMKKVGLNRDSEMKRLYRKVRPVDVEKYEEAKSREHDTMLKARKIAEDLGLDMKIGDVEYQGDCGKAIFYYIAEGRVDFRQLIKVLAEVFKVRIEMKQIGARQEAGRIGGIGPCGRELCCASWMTSFASVATGAARHQDISLNPQKLAGQCAKLKCCINYEVDIYVEAQKQLPSREIALETKEGVYYHFKTDILKREISYSTSPTFPANLVTIPAKRAFEIIALNKRGVKVDQLEENAEKDEPQREFQDGVGDDSLTRFDKNRQKRNKRVAKKGDNQSNNAEGNNNNNNGGNNTPKQPSQPKQRPQGNGNPKPQQGQQPKQVRPQEQRSQEQRPPRNEGGQTPKPATGNEKPGEENPNRRNNNNKRRHNNNNNRRPRPNGEQREGGNPQSQEPRMKKNNSNGNQSNENRPKDKE
ncbi:MAG: PSP1 domain-containing protein [Bacteroidales bacterium]